MAERDKPELNGNIYTHPDNYFSYFNVYICFTRIIVLLTASCFYENLDNSSSLKSEIASSVK